MMKLALLGAAAVLSAALATPVMAQEATQEPGMIGFNYPNSDYLTGGWGVHTPPSWTGGRPRIPYGGYVGYGYPPGVVYAPGVRVGPYGVMVRPPYGAYAPYGAYVPYGAYAYDPY
jgi:hypothetical protein